MKTSVLKYLCLMGVLLVVVGCTDEGEATLTIVNQSNETVVLLQVTVNENMQTVKDLEHGEEAEMHFLVKRDTDYHVDVEFVSGRKINKEVGYLSYGFNAEDVVRINQSDIEFTRIFVEIHR